MEIDKKHIEKILSQVTDPEIPVLTIQDMGILRNVEIVNDLIKVIITPTYSGCPAMDMISINIKSALQDEGYNNVEILSILSPVWTTDWMSSEAKAKLKAYGIAPPVEKTNDTSFISGSKKIVACPQCDSNNTKLISQFGSTACKALYQCNDCKEAFDYFKCY
ncbi:MAG: 1,2-phenylacetyl-CoA epoxidase subunit PaaD [Saprospiraceae bacterium]